MKNEITCKVLRGFVIIFVPIFLAMVGPSTANCLEPLSIEEAELFLEELKNDPNPFKQQNYYEYLSIFMESSVLTEYPPAVLQILAICLTERLTPLLLTMTPAQLSKYSHGGQKSRTDDDKIFNECWEELQKQIKKNK